MVISFTGAQSTGKSTLFEKMKPNDRFRRFNYVPEITRNLREKYNRRNQTATTPQIRGIMPLALCLSHIHREGGFLFCSRT